MKKTLLFSLLICISCIASNAQLITTFANASAIGSAVGIAFDNAGYLYGANEGGTIYKISPSGTVTIIAGNGTYGFSGDGGPATAAALYEPMGVAIDAAGNVFIADMGNERIRKVNTSGIISTIAGCSPTAGIGGFGGDGGPATAAQLSQPIGVMVDNAGNVFIADGMNGRIRKVNTSGIISTFAGGGSGGDGIPATATSFDQPVSVTMDTAGNIYVADYYTGRVRKINTSGIISTVAGGVGAGFPDGLYNGDNIPATAAALNGTSGVAFDGVGNMYITDGMHHRLRKVDASGIITTIAGTGICGYSGDGGPAPFAQICRPLGVAVNNTGKIFVSSYNDGNIREIDNTVHIPYFAGGQFQSLNICNSSFNNDTLLVTPQMAVIDLDTASTLTWTIASFPQHGTLDTPYAYATTANGGTITPLPLTYTRNTGYYGNDTFKLGVTDGTASDITSIYVYCFPPASVPVIASIQNEEIQISPNPSSGSFSLNISAPVEEKVAVTISDMVGNTVKAFTVLTNKTEEMTLDVRQGVYVITTTSAHEKHYEKLVITR